MGAGTEAGGDGQGRFPLRAVVLTCRGFCLEAYVVVTTGEVL